MSVGTYIFSLVLFPLALLPFFYLEFTFVFPLYFSSSILPLYIITWRRFFLPFADTAICFLVLYCKSVFRHQAFPDCVQSNFSFFMCFYTPVLSYLTVSLRWSGEKRKQRWIGPRQEMKSGEWCANVRVWVEAQKGKVDRSGVGKEEVPYINHAVFSSCLQITD